MVKTDQNHATNQSRKASLFRPAHSRNPPPNVFKRSRSDKFCSDDSVTHTYTFSPQVETSHLRVFLTACGRLARNALLCRGPRPLIPRSLTPKASTGQNEQKKPSWARTYHTKAEETGSSHYVLFCQLLTGLILALWGEHMLCGVGLDWNSSLSYSSFLVCEWSRMNDALQRKLTLLPLHM